ncbi:hypothetical protein AK812_SmicGene20829 [Symbiodinium microadriaticum]|uniref:Nucleotide-diphospho-sugar transferase domain-containing protein n=1 Tax=Symbiodinium microadriaticum TaxID=2951 RepID=A0A1Q9DP00_SYMMI|nr:hypothetical protein AK812_SmicGene20829 [Symbiodinium microadriaticum]
MWDASFWCFLILAAKAQDPEKLLPDYDCIRPSREAPLLDWAEWLQALQRPRGEGWLAVSSLPLSLLTDESNRQRAIKECPLGLLMADILQMLACFDKLHACSDTFERLVRDGMAFFGLRVLMGTRWPIYESLHSDVWDRIAEEDRGETDLACEDPEKRILNWGAFKRLFSLQDWYQPAVDVAYGPELEKMWREAALECPLGFATANLIKAMLCSHTESICFRAHETMLGAVLQDIPLQRVAASGWPLLHLLGHVSRVVRRHRFQLDFAPNELLSRPSPTYPREDLEAEDSLSMQDLQALTALVLRDSADDAAARFGYKTSIRLRLIYATMAHGPRFSPYVSRFIGRATAVGIGAQLVVFCLDEEASAECRNVKGNCVRGTPSILNKFTLPLVLLQHDFDVMWLDLDVFLFQSPTLPLIRQLRENSELELLISGSFAVDCICSGIVLFRAVESVRSWLALLLVWMYEHPYEHDQKAFSAFLRAGERVAFESELPVAPERVPRWDFLDPETEFVSARHVDVAGWTGDADKIIAFHLLHGDSDDADASRQFAARHGLGIGYEPLLDLFFNRTDFPELYKTPVLPHRLSSELRDALWRSRWPTPRPNSPARCNETVPMRF